MCALELISVNNLINYFGDSKSVDDITIDPILIAKGKTKLGEDITEFSMRS